MRIRRGGKVQAVVERTIGQIAPAAVDQQQLQRLAIGADPQRTGHRHADVALHAVEGAGADIHKFDPPALGDEALQRARQHAANHHPNHAAKHDHQDQLDQGEAALAD
ncbi:hypothetical protein D3C78_1013740 [compost metagenome]